MTRNPKTNCRKDNTMSDLETLQAEANQFKQDFQRILQEVHKVIVGQERVVECAVTALLAGGNVLLEGVPGLGKTELVKTLGHVLDLEFRRIQFTPDLMPADIIGTNIMTAGPDGALSLRVPARADLHPVAARR